MQARALRHDQTSAELRLWKALRRRLAVEHTHFRRQVAIPPFIVDFCCLAKRLVVEVDGESHQGKGETLRDERRTSYLEAKGFRVLRFWNNAVYDDIDGVLEAIRLAIEDGGVPPPRTPPRKGEEGL